MILKINSIMEKSILIIHGWGAYTSSWSKVKQNLTKAGFKVYVPDLPGFGVDKDPRKPWSTDDYVEWIKQYTERNKLRKFTLLGHSFGGRLAVKFSTKYRKKVTGLILLDSSWMGSENKLGFRVRFLFKLSELKYFLTSLGFFGKIIYPFMRELSYFLAGTREYYLIKTKVMKKTFEKTAKDNLNPCLSQSDIPTLIVWGEKDRIIPLGVAYGIKEKIQNSKLYVISKIGHNPHLECPDKLSRIINKFLRLL